MKTYIPLLWIAPWIENYYLGTSYLHNCDLCFWGDEELEAWEVGQELGGN